MARAQLWQTTAAKHVSLDPQLQAVTALAGRWRRQELASWRRLLARTIDAYAAGVFLVWLCGCQPSVGCTRPFGDAQALQYLMKNNSQTRPLAKHQPPAMKSTHNSPNRAENPLGGPSPTLHVFFTPFSAILAKIKCSICSDQFDR